MYKETENLKEGEFGTVVVDAIKDGDRWNYKCAYLSKEQSLSNSRMMWCNVNGQRVQVR